jgi:uncharacterized protein YeaO (DUF488 family)
MITTKRAYEPASPDDGIRILVDRLWPRGVTKDRLMIREWMKEVAPSDELRRWFSHDPSKWEKFLERYRKEVEQKPEFRRLGEMARKGKVTLVYGSKETRFNNATALKMMLEEGS